MTSKVEKLIPVKLVGTDGNAFALIGRCMAAARRHGCTQAEVDEIVSTLTSAKSYDALLAKITERFDVR